jgi:hypothetical protein
VFTKPDVPFGLQLGGSVYLDRVSTPGQPEFDERIISAHAVWSREDPEVIAEIAHVRHERIDGQLDASSLAYYVQAAYRFPGAGARFKPYYRFEHIDVDSIDPVFGAVPNLDGSTFGVRFDISTFAAIKTEGRARKRTAGGPWMNGWFAQIAFTF